MTPGEREWDETLAFFSAEELIQAGFDAGEVRIAFDGRPRRSRSSSHESPRGYLQNTSERSSSQEVERARLSAEYQRGYAAGHGHGVLSGAGRILRNSYANEEDHQHENAD